MALHPCLERFALAGNIIPGFIEAVVSLVITERIGGIGSAWLNANRVDHPTRQGNGIQFQFEALDNFLNRHDDPLGGEHSFLLHTGNAPHHYIAAAISLLSMDHRDVRADGRHGGQLLTCERAGDRFDDWVYRRQVATDIASHNCERKAARASNIGVGYIGVAVFFNVKRRWPALFNRIAEPV